MSVNTQKVRKYNYVIVVQEQYFKGPLLDQFINKVQAIGLKYGIIALERGQTKPDGTPGNLHLQCYFQFKNQIWATSLRKKLPHVHIEEELPYSDGPSNVRYCKKGEQSHDEYEQLKDKGPNYGKNVKILFEYGEVSNPSKRGKRNDLKRVDKAIREEGMTMKQLVENKIIKNNQTFNYAKNIMPLLTEERKQSPLVIYLWGASNTGKTQDAIQIANTYSSVHYQAGDNSKFWDSYEQDPCVVIEEFKGKFCSITKMLSILDRFPLKVEVKGSSREFNSNCIIFTSQFNPAHVYPTEDVTQFIKRIDIIRFYTYDRQGNVVKHDIKNADVDNSNKYCNIYNKNVTELLLKLPLHGGLIKKYEQHNNQHEQKRVETLFSNKLNNIDTSVFIPNRPLSLNTY